MTSHPRIVAAIFIIAGVAVVASTGATYWFGNRVLQARAREQLRRETISNLQQLIATLKNAESGQRGYLLTGDEKYLEPFDDAGKILGGVLGKLKQTQTLELSRDAIQTIVRMTEGKMAELRRTIELRRHGDADAAAAIVRTGRGKELMDDLRAAIGRLEQEQGRKLEGEMRAADKAIRLRTLVFLLAGCGNILFLGWAYHRISHAMEEREATAVMYRGL
jgi:CHASE3 domain sensor protein